MLLDQLVNSLENVLLDESNEVRTFLVDKSVVVSNFGSHKNHLLVKLNKVVFFLF